jgi:branched-subunit amino acid ABC-type transport system permease component
VSGLRTTGSLDQGHFGQLIVTLGISLVLQNGDLILFGSTPQTVRTPLASSAIEVGPWFPLRPGPAARVGGFCFLGTLSYLPRRRAPTRARTG